jgi:opacity protein-like surface antigen
MKTTRFVLLISLMLVFLFPSYVSAQENIFYLTVKPGLYSPQTNDLEDFDTGFNGEISFGRQYNKNFAAEMGLGYFTTKGEQRSSGRVNGITYSATADEQITVVPVTLTLKGIYPINKWELFALGGIGAYIVSGDLKLNIAANGLSISDTVEDTKTIFGAHLGLGVHYNITPTFFVGVEGKYLLTSEAKLKGELSTIPVEAKFNLNGILATAVIGLRF